MDLVPRHIKDGALDVRLASAGLHAVVAWRRAWRSVVAGADQGWKHVLGETQGGQSIAISIIGWRIENEHAMSPGRRKRSRSRRMSASSPTGDKGSEHT